MQTHLLAMRTLKTNADHSGDDLSLPVSS